MSKESLMLELRLQRVGTTLTVILGEYADTIPFASVAMHDKTWRCIYDDAITYGKELFERTFRQDDLRGLLTGISANERLVVVADDPLVASIPWEYLRDMQGK